MIEVAPERRDPLRPLFVDIPGLHGCLDAVLNGDFGLALADDDRTPRTALLQLDFTFLGGDPGTAAAKDAFAMLGGPRASHIVATQDWVEPIKTWFGDRVSPHERADFSPGEWEVARLRGFLDLPAGFDLVAVDASNVERFAALERAFVDSFDSLEDFLARGAGFGVIHRDGFVSGCSSFTLSRGKLEFEIDTQPDYRRRGLATAVAARMLLHCIENAIEPCWDAHNPISAALARKLGFIERNRYFAWVLAPE